jgi:hypothetical protein
LIALASLSALALTPRVGAALVSRTGLGGGPGTVKTTNLCSPVTPVVYALDVSAPPAGSGQSCTNDTQCTGAGEYCGFSAGATIGTCQASGLLSRGDIRYVAGGLVDIDVTIPQCTGVADVTMNGASLSGSGGFDSTTPASWWSLGSTATTFNGQPAVRQRVRVQFSNFGDGLTTSIGVLVSAVGGMSTSASFTLANVAAVNAAMRSTVAETRVRNEFVTSLYHKFGDNDEVLDDQGSRVAYDVSWDPLSAYLSGGFVYYRGSDIRIQQGQIAFATQFMGDAPLCDDSVYVDGWFTLAPGGDGVDLQWIMAPRADVETGLFCKLISLGIWQLVTEGFADEASITGPFAESLSAGFGADANGHIKVCDLCRVTDVLIGNGVIDIYTVPPVDRVRLNVSTTRFTDATADPTQGLILPAGFYAPIAAGGTYVSCQAANGSSTSSCGTTFAVDLEGLFNWWGSDVPVPNPWYTAPNGATTIIWTRKGAWDRLLGLTRDVTELPEKTFPAGALLARRTTTSPVFPTTREKVSNGCVIPPDANGPVRFTLGINDVPAVGSQPPTNGKLDATVLMAADAGQSKTLFGNNHVCTAAPSSNAVFTTWGGSLLLQ